MKYSVTVCLFVLMSSDVCGTWKIGKIKNDSDLVFKSAWSSGGKSKPKKIKRLTKFLKNKDDFSPWKVSDKFPGCSFIKMNGGYQISVDAYPAHKVHWGQGVRTITGSNKKYFGKSACDPSKYHYCARVFFEDKDGQIIDHDAQGYNTEDVIFNIVISKINGKYSVKLKNVWD